MIHIKIEQHSKAHKINIQIKYKKRWGIQLDDIVDFPHNLRFGMQYFSVSDDYIEKENPYICVKPRELWLEIVR